MLLFMLLLLMLLCVPIVLAPLGETFEEEGRRSERTKAASSKTEATPRGRRRSREDASPREFPHCD